ncbi:hypothetical protein HYALB_00013137 [Hymenoscyphus albidus]|uniref:NADP-dependent oxidoreductase domain-containing protein n=1 Tax=Hymenoscyphus albidus TaxID=595503 RepID=A0A9N9LRK4_9HELO|nr:hypothetical protein HYALB_00013137 [Hymenoscyphus albidus]
MSSESKTTLLMPYSPKSHPEVKIPKLIYGLVYDAIKSGFRGIDTAAQPRHYQEDLVCQGIKKAINEGIVTRKELHIKHPPPSPSGQDLDNMPYDASAPLATQITDSINSSLKNFTFSSGEEPYIDTLILHSPLKTLELNYEAFNLLASYVPTKIRSLGISNTDLKTLTAMHEKASIPPCIVQNRFYPATGYDVPLRDFCL